MSQPEISVNEAAARDDGAVLLDVREQHEWDAGHAPGAVHLPMGDVTLDNLPAGRPVLCICRSGARSANITAALVEAGIDARNVTGGMIAWADAGLPIEQ